MQGPLPKHPPPSAMVVPPNNDFLTIISRAKNVSSIYNILMIFFMA